LVRRLPDWSLDEDPLVWRTNLGLRGLRALHIKFADAERNESRMAASESA
jgi:hypothetical protein